jgi:hypothetical protein
VAEENDGPFGGIFQLRSLAKSPVAPVVFSKKAL